MTDSFSKQDMLQLVSLIEDGELDDYFIELREAIDDRLSRKKDAVLKMVKAAFGEDARVVNGNVVTGSGKTVSAAPSAPSEAPAEVVLPDGSVLVPDDPMVNAAPPEGAMQVGSDEVLDSIGGEYINMGASMGKYGGPPDIQ